MSRVKMFDVLFFDYSLFRAFFFFYMIFILPFIAVVV